MENIFLQISVFVALIVFLSSSSGVVDTMKDITNQTLTNASNITNKTSQEVKKTLDPIESILDTINSIVMQIQNIIYSLSNIFSGQ